VVNHIRTLLLNEVGTNNPGYSFALEEYVPADYIPVKPNNACRLALMALFGLSPDRAYKNWRLHQVSKIAEACSFSSYWHGFDSRITHFNRPDASLDNSFGKVTVTSTSGGGSNSIVYVYSDGRLLVSESLTSPSQTADEEIIGMFLNGKPEADESRGRAVTSWQITSGGSGSLSVRKLTDPVYEEDMTLSFSNGISNSITLAGSGLVAKFRNSPGITWDITTVARPSMDIGTTIANIDNLSAEVSDYLFSNKNPDIVTLKRYWDSSIDAYERLSAFVLALAYRLEEKRKAA
jgi:hypothetical protein